jgi:hypothetical protein
MELLVKYQRMCEATEAEPTERSRRFLRDLKLRCFLWSDELGILTEQGKLEMQRMQDEKAIEPMLKQEEWFVWETDPLRYPLF